MEAMKWESGEEDLSRDLVSKNLSPSLSLPEVGRGLHPPCHCLLDLILGFETGVNPLCIDKTFVEG